MIGTDIRNNSLVTPDLNAREMPSSYLPLVKAARFIGDIGEGWADSVCSSLLRLSHNGFADVTTAPIDLHQARESLRLSPDLLTGFGVKLSSIIRAGTVLDLAAGRFPGSLAALSRFLGAKHYIGTDLNTFPRLEEAEDFKERVVQSDMLTVVSRLTLNSIAGVFLLGLADYSDAEAANSLYLEALSVELEKVVTPKGFVIINSETYTGTALRLENHGFLMDDDLTEETRSKAPESHLRIYRRNNLG
jgi:hypothetical protein